MKIKVEDRGQLDPPRIAGVIVKVTRHGTYRIGFGNGVLKDSLCLRDLIVLTDHTAAMYPGFEEVLDNWQTTAQIGIRTAAKFASVAGGQGFLHCSCTTKCETKRCGCFKN